MAKRKSLPHNTDAEKAVLGAMLRSKTKMNEIFSELTVDDFYEENENHRAIFKAMERLYKRGVPVDTQILTDELINSNEIEISGGPEYLYDLAESVVTFANLSYYLKIVKDQALLRRFLTTIEDIQNDYYSKDIGDITTFLGNSEKALGDISEKRRIGDFQSAKVVSTQLSKEFQEMKEAATDDAVTDGGTPTGFTKLNRYTHGFHKGEFIVLAARPGVGKTALALNLAFNAAVRGKPVGYFSLEMPATQLFKRLISADSGVPYESLITGYGINRNNVKLKLQEACNRMAGIKFFVEDTSGIKLLDLVAKTKKLKDQEPDLGLVVVDYIGLVTPPNGKKSDGRQQEVQLISQTLKKLALELKIPIIGVAQLNRKVDERAGGEPLLSDLRESGSIEQDADIVLLLHEPKFNASPSNGKDLFEKQNKAVDEAQQQIAQKEGGKDTTIVTITIAKNRSGKQGKVPLLFRKNCQKFDNPSTEGENQFAELEKERISYLGRE